jgi:chemotaxis protein MotB
MKNLIIIIFTVLLVGALLSGFLFYGKYVDLKDTLKTRSEDVASLNGTIRTLEGELEKNKGTGEAMKKELLRRDARIAELQEELRAKEVVLQAQIRENAEQLKEHRSATACIAQLEETIRERDQELLKISRQLKSLEGELEKNKGTGEAMKKELLRRDARIAELQEELGGERATAQSKIEELKSAYTSLVSGLREQLKGKEMTLKAFEEKLSITFVDRILFDLGKATITPEGARVLKKVGHILKNAQGMQIRVVGHTDSIPIGEEYHYKFPSNWELSAARAASVVRFFQRECRLDPQDLEAVGKSFYEPVASNEVEEGRAQNRRVEVIIAPKMDRKQQ